MGFAILVLAVVVVSVAQLQGANCTLFSTGPGACQKCLDLVRFKLFSFALRVRN
jgi:hypothetical protein